LHLYGARVFAVAWIVGGLAMVVFGYLLLPKGEEAEMAKSRDGISGFLARSTGYHAWGLIAAGAIIVVKSLFLL
jgi:hypothetical protein